MRCQIQLRVCNASSKAKALVRNARRIGWKAGELRSATRACCGTRATAGVAQLRDGVAQSGEAGRVGAVVPHVENLVLSSWVLYSNLLHRSRVPVPRGVPARSRKGLQIEGGDRRQSAKFW